MTMLFAAQNTGSCDMASDAEIWFMDTDTGLRASSSGGDGIYNLSLPFPAGAPEGRYLFEAVVPTIGGPRSDVWPYLTVR
jgi:hypothetical protein